MQNAQKSLILVFLQILCLLFLIATGPIVPSGLTRLFMVCVGIVLGAWALLSLRKSLSPFPDVKTHAKLITHGPYEIIRHPMYTAMILITCALVLNEMTIPRFLVFGLLIIILLIKLSYEEELLTKRFHEQYRAYQKRTKRIIPYVY